MATWRRGDGKSVFPNQCVWGRREGPGDPAEPVLGAAPGEKEAETAFSPRAVCRNYDPDKRNLKPTFLKNKTKKKERKYKFEVNI